MRKLEEVQKQADATKDTLVELDKYKKAMFSPRIAFKKVGPDSLSAALQIAVADPASSVSGFPLTTPDEKLQALSVIEGAGNAADDIYKSEIRKALGINPDINSPDAANVNNDIQNFINNATYENIFAAVGKKLRSVNGSDLLAKVDTLLNRLNTATRNARTAMAIKAPPATDIDAALKRAGL